MSFPLCYNQGIAGVVYERDHGEDRVTLAAGVSSSPLLPHSTSIDPLSKNSFQEAFGEPLKFSLDKPFDMVKTAACS